MNKKINISLITIIAFLFLQNAGFALTNPNFCPSSPYPISSVYTRGIQTVFGLNFFARHTAQRIIKSQLKNMAKGEFKVKVYPYSAFDLTSGKLKGFEIKADDFSMEEVYVSHIEARSLCEFSYFDIKKNPVELLAPVYLEFKGTITQDDLNKTISAPKNKDQFSKIKISLYNADLNLVDFYEPKIQIKNSKLYFSTKMHFAGMPKYLTIPVNVGAELIADSNKIRMGNLEILSGSLGRAPIERLMEIISPAIFNFRELEKTGAKINIINISVKDDKIDVRGTIFLPPVK
jgi:hypothetical protein